MSARDDTTSHQPYLSSLIVRHSHGGAYDPGVLRRDAPPYSRSDRYSDEPGYRGHAFSVSPVRRRGFDRRHSPELDYHLDGSPHRRSYGRGRVAPRSPGRYRNFSPPHTRGRGRGGRHFGRGFDGLGFGRGASRGGGMNRNNSNVRPREGDWICSHPMCGNLNFAHREICNNCERNRYAPAVSPRRGYGPPPPMGPSRHFPGPPMDRSPGTFMDGSRSPPRRPWPRDGPRDFGPDGPRGPPPPPRHEGFRRDHRFYHPEEDIRVRGKFARPPQPELAARDRLKERYMERKGYEKRPISPLPMSPPADRGQWVDRVIRERSRSPIRRGPPPKDFRREHFMGTERDERRGPGQDRIGNVY